MNNLQNYRSEGEPIICYSEIVAYNIIFYGTITSKHIIDNMNNTTYTNTYGVELGFSGKVAVAAPLGASVGIIR